MNDTANALVPTDLPASRTRTPSKPVQTPVPLEDLVRHYNSQLEAYNGAVEKAPASTTAQPMGPLLSDDPSITKEQVIELIRKQNYRLGRFVRHRSIELLQAVVTTNADNRTVGYSYAEVLGILRVEFPEGSTSAAALRWYVVHLWSEADDEGLRRPKMPQIRPRSVKSKPPVQDADA